MFFKLQHLEDHLDVLQPARDELLAMFSRGISLALGQPEGVSSKSSILSIEHYDAKKIWAFIEDEHDRVTGDWSSYLERRRQGQGSELFATVEGAKAYLVQQAPVKFVDGAWLAHTHKITTPFALRSVTKDAWQVLSEELGDGHLDKHHVYLYSQLLNEVGCPLPDGHSPDFIKARHWVGDGKDKHGAWEAAVGQLLISLFPNEFLPEILGFNMHYELITLDTMRAAHELRALGINPYYFLIHIAIDNADSGHTAMATHTVTRYLDMVRATEGEEALQQAWKRVQVGYSMSQTLGSSAASTSTTPSIEGPYHAPRYNTIAPPPDPLGARVIEIFKAKASVSHQFHCQSRARIGGQTLVEWLAPSKWTRTEPGQRPDPQQQRHQLELLAALGHQAKPWVYAGASSKSLLVRELSWEGRMFGAFTHDEVVALSAWIDSLGPDKADTSREERDAWLYWSFVHMKPVKSGDAVGGLRDPARDHPVVGGASQEMETEVPAVEESDDLPELQDILSRQKPLGISPTHLFPDLISLWFAHISLLENTINTPGRTASPLYAAILRLLRAQAGFALETHIVAGMDEMKRLTCPSLVDLGLEMLERSGSVTDDEKKVSCLHDILVITESRGQSEKSKKLTRDMLWWGARPQANLGLLLGLAVAFLEMKDAVAKAEGEGSLGLLSEESRVVLRAIVERERQSLEECARELRRVDGRQYGMLLKGYEFGRGLVEGCCC
ncbi:hypothetical protein B0T17DRAFT_618158 [Bombardia bombarda]|uniref:Uncharacterized protein n=1 Tax=Bombardia bombarda TaxID=252184 RepID=A0AA39WUA8_9PEZI|nr:hypothetical protein B0T17DRAFT_618158 [Bombardia bombarda]